MSRKPHGWLTPDSIPAETICRALLIPNDEGILAAVRGAVLDLCYAHNWEQQGAVTPQQMADAMVLMFDGFLNGACDVAQEMYIFIHEAPQNTAGGGYVASAESVIANYVQRYAGGANADIFGGNVRVQPGVWYVEAWHIIRFTGLTKFGVLLNNADVPRIEGESDSLSTTRSTNFHAKGVFTVASGTCQVIPTCQAGTSAPTNAFGMAANRPGRTEIYGETKLIRLGDAP